MLGRKFSFLLAKQESRDFFQCRSIVNSDYIGSRMEQNPEFEKEFNLILNQTNLTSKLSDSSELVKFEQNFLPWLKSHKYNTIQGLENFNSDFSSGTTQAFDSFYLRHRNKRFRCFTGEYFYHIKVWKSLGINWEWVTDYQNLQFGDALIISVPFCDTATIHSEIHQILEHCSLNSIPVLIDMCYYPISHNIMIDVNYPCVDTVAFSLSKAWPVGNARIGIRYTNKSIFDGQKLHSEIKYNNNFSAYIGNLIINNWAADWVFEAREEQYDFICKTLGLAKTNSVCFGIGDSSWDQYSRRRMLDIYKLNFDPKLFVNRICLNKIYQHWDLFTKFILYETNIKF